MAEQLGSDQLVSIAADIVSAYVSNNPVPSSDLPTLIGSIHKSLSEGFSLTGKVATKWPGGVAAASRNASSRAAASTSRRCAPSPPGGERPDLPAAAEIAVAEFAARHLVLDDLAVVVAVEQREHLLLPRIRSRRRQHAVAVGVETLDQPPAPCARRASARSPRRSRQRSSCRRGPCRHRRCRDFIAAENSSNVMSPL